MKRLTRSLLLTALLSASTFASEEGVIWPDKTPPPPPPAAQPVDEQIAEFFAGLLLGLLP